MTRSRGPVPYLSLPPPVNRRLASSFPRLSPQLHAPLPVMQVIPIGHFLGHAVVGGGDVAAALAHGGEDAVDHAVDVPLGAGEDALVDAAEKGDLGPLRADLDDVAARRDLEGRHDVHADLAIDGDGGPRVAVCFDLNVDMAGFVDLTRLHVGDELLIVGNEEFAHYVGRDQDAVVVTNVLGEVDLVDAGR